MEAPWLCFLKTMHLLLWLFLTYQQVSRCSISTIMKLLGVLQPSSWGCWTWHRMCWIILSVSWTSPLQSAVLWGISLKRLWWVVKAKNEGLCWRETLLSDAYFLNDTICLDKALFFVLISLIPSFYFYLLSFLPYVLSFLFPAAFSRPLPSPPLPSTSPFPPPSPSPPLPISKRVRSLQKF